MRCSQLTYLTSLCIALSPVGACSNYADPDFPEEPVPVVARYPEPERPPLGTLWRQDVLGVVDSGLGTFLQKVRVEAELEQGRFTGFKILELRPPTFWLGVDLQPGDVVTRVNGLPIERDTEAFAAFTSLKEAQELRVELIRSGQPRVLVYRIVEGPARQSAAAGGAS